MQNSERLRVFDVLIFSPFIDERGWSSHYANYFVRPHENPVPHSLRSTRG